MFKEEEHLAVSYGTARAMTTSPLAIGANHGASLLQDKVVMRFGLGVLIVLVCHGKMVKSLVLLYEA